jgi:hypothetical protein
MKRSPGRAGSSDQGKRWQENLGKEMSPFKRLGKKTPLAFVPEVVAFPPVTMFRTWVTAVRRESSYLISAMGCSVAKGFCPVASAYTQTPWKTLRISGYAAMSALAAASLRLRAAA